jgi:hypothetical protein
MTVNFLAPAKPGPITAEAQVAQLGKTIAFVAGRLIAADGTVLATASVSARLLEAAKAIRELAFARDDELLCPSTSDLHSIPARCDLRRR